MNEPLVSIVIPCFNAASTIRQTLRSIELNGYSHYEIVLIDDGSIDETMEILEPIMNKDRRLKVYHQNNRGVSAARNIGVQRASSEFIAFLDADDIFFKGCIIDRLKVLIDEEDENLIGSFCPAFLLGEDLYPLLENPLFNYTLPDNKLYFSSVPGSVFNPSSVIVKKRKILESGGFSIDLDSSEDFELWHRMMSKGDYFKKATESVIGWVQHPSSTTHVNHIHHYKQYRKVIDKLFNGMASMAYDSEYEGGLGYCYYKDVISKRAITSAIMSSVAGKPEDAIEISKDISKRFLEKLDPKELINTIKFCAIKTLCKSEKFWPSPLWINIRNSIQDLFNGLRDDNCSSKKFQQFTSAFEEIDKTCIATVGSRIEIENNICNNNRNKVTIAYFPFFANKEELTNQYWRMLWYLSPIEERIHRIHIGINSEKIKTLKMPEFFDPAIKKLSTHLDQKVRYSTPNELDAYLHELENADFILSWKQDDHACDPKIRELAIRILKKKKVLNIDHEKSRFEGSIYLSISKDLNPNRKNDLWRSRSMFLRMVEEFRENHRGYIFGTGPSLSQAMNRNFSDGIVIACNSMVKNTALMDHLQPKIIAIADPIFHAGCSSYAGEFRRHLCRALDTFAPYLIVPFRDLRLYQKNLPHRYQSKLIGIPFEHIEHVNLNIRDNFIVKTTSNILTLFLLPIASTLFKEVNIMGCDGRKVEDNKYFWEHHKESQLVDQMRNIKRAHPAFFNIDYDEYYQTHCQILENWMTEGELRGIKYRNHTPSYIPALQRRQKGENDIDVSNKIVYSPTFPRDVHAQFDESRFVLHMISNKLDGNVLDVGAHHGGTSIPFARAGFNVHAFEPDPDNRKVLLKKIQPGESIKVDHRAVSDAASVGIPFYNSDESTGISSLLPFRDTHKKACIVDVTTIEHYCLENHIEKIDFLKIDTEGYDLLVLKGVPWESLKPAIILCEFEDCKTEELGYTYHQMAEFLTDKGYTVFVSEWHPIIRYGIAHDWNRFSKYPCSLASKKAWGNLIAFKDAPDDSMVRKFVEKSITAKSRNVASTMPSRFVKFKNVHCGERCVIIGNGASLNRMDLSFLQKEISFGLNRIYLIFDKWKFRPTYYVAVNPLVIGQSNENIRKLTAPKFLSDFGRKFFKESEDVFFVKNTEDWKFSKDPNLGLCEGWTVTYVAIQLAYYMGFKEVVLIGVDHDFQACGSPNQEVVSEGPDPNHFHPDYFGKGVRWHLPDLERSERSYRMAKEAFESEGRRILDGTVDGKLTVFPKIDYREHFGAEIDENIFHSGYAGHASKAMAYGEHFLSITERSAKTSEPIDNASKRTPEGASAAFAMGLLHEERGDTERAIEAFEAAVRLAPEKMDYAKVLAKRYHETCGRSIDALNLLRRAFEADENDGTTLLMIGEILHAVGREKEALYFMETAERLVANG
jgi:FkbM family methyltransferase